MPISKPKFPGGTEITLGTTEFLIVDLAPRQLRVVVPLLASMRNLQDINNLDEKSMDALFKAVFVTLSRNYPDFTLDEFLDMPIKMDQIAIAMPKILPHMGMEMREAAAVPGEAMEGTQASPTA